MIHDAQVEVTCDGCMESVYISLPAGARNTYLADDHTIEVALESHGWIVMDDGHYCDCCAEDMEEEE